MGTRTLVLRLVGSPFIATKKGDGWEVIDSRSNTLCAWVAGGRKDAMEELRSQTAKLRQLDMFEVPKDN